MITLLGYMEERLHGCYQSEGKVYPQEQDSTVRLKAELAYDEYQWETETSVTVKNQNDAIDKSEKSCSGNNAGKCTDIRSGAGSFYAA